MVSDNIYDVAVVGGGTGGYSTALRAAQLGLTVVLVDSGDRLGGTCLNRGCVPTKALLTAARIADEARKGSDWGITYPAPAINGATLHDKVKSVVIDAVSGLESLVSARGITYVHGTVTDCVRTTSTGMWTLHISPPASAAASSSSVVGARHVVVATGSRPRALEGVPFDGPVLDSTGALNLTHIPHSAAIIGSGAVALEFASAWGALGADVTVLLRHDRPLTGWDRRVSMAVMRGMAGHGVKFIRNMTVTNVVTRQNDDGAIAHVDYTVTRGRTSVVGFVEAEVCVVAVGREPVTDELFIDKLNVVDNNSSFIPVDGWGRTRTAGIWAAGDVTAGKMLAHRAFDQGIRAAESIAVLHRAHAAWDDSTVLTDAGIGPYEDAVIPQVVFSFPQAACVGLSEDEAKLRGYGDVVRTDMPLMGLARYAMAGDPAAAVIVTGRRNEAGPLLVLGVALVGSAASENIAEAQQVIRARIPLHEVAAAIHAHPTFSEALGEAFLRADGRPLHTL